MGSQEKARELVVYLLSKFNSEYETQWEDESFSVLPSGQFNGRGVDFDTTLYWKVYDQQRFAGRSERFFTTLARLRGSGPEMVRCLATLTPYQSSLLQAYRNNRLPNDANSAVNAGPPGWQVLGYAVRTSELLVKRYGTGESQSYAAQWMTECISTTRWDGIWASLVRELNKSVSHIVNLPSALNRIGQLRNFINNVFVEPAQLHLPGIGLNVLSYFLRDWVDFHGVPYCWKHDEKNRKFWSRIVGTGQFGLQGADEKTVLSFLIQNLEPEELASGALAKINRAVYGLAKDLETSLRDLSQIP